MSNLIGSITLNWIMVFSLLIFAIVFTVFSFASSRPDRSSRKFELTVITACILGIVLIIPR